VCVISCVDKIESFVSNDNYGQEIITADSFCSCIAIVARQGNKKARVLSFVVIYRPVQVGDVYERAIHSLLDISGPSGSFYNSLESLRVEPAQLERAIIDLFRMWREGELCGKCFE